MSKFPIKLGELIEVKIEKLAFGGRGLARHQGLVIFVPFSTPKDCLLVEITEVKKNFVEAKIAKIIEPGPSRIQAPCPVYEKCGGCDLQHINYAEQLKIKESQVFEFLKKSQSEPFEFLPIEPSPQDFRYRNRVQIKTDGKNFGFFAKGSHDLVPIDDCLLLEKTLADKLRQLSSDKKEKLSQIQNIILSSNENSETHFSQVNSGQNRNLVDTLTRWCENIPAQHFYDLYCGEGNFSFPILLKFPKLSVLGVELNAQAIRQAKKRAEQLRLKSCQFFTADTELFLRRSKLNPQSIVLIDPPRIGCSENTIRYLANEKILRLFYISCDPASLSRDILRLKSENPSWRILRAKSFDMFPQTHHIETLVELAVDS